MPPRKGSRMWQRNAVTSTDGLHELLLCYSCEGTFSERLKFGLVLLQGNHHFPNQKGISDLRKEDQRLTDIP